MWIKCRRFYHIDYFSLFSGKEASRYKQEDSEYIQDIDISIHFQIVMKKGSR